MDEVESDAAQVGARDADLRSPEAGNHSSGDRYVAGGVHWESFSHRQLFAMLHERADVAAVHEAADRWQQYAESIGALADRFGRMLASLEAAWSGESADSAISALRKNTEWLAQLARTTTDMARPIDEAAYQLSAAQRAMPAPPDTEGTPAGAVTGSAAGPGTGFLIAVVGAVTGGTTSVVGSMIERSAEKDQAVYVMREHERGSRVVDADTPQFSDALTTIPGLVSMPGLAAAVGRTVAASTAHRRARGGPPEVRQAPTGDSAAGAGAAQTSTAASWAAVGPEARWQAMTSTSAVSGTVVGNQPVGGSVATHAACSRLVGGGGVLPPPVDRTTSRAFPASGTLAAGGARREEGDRTRSYPYDFDLFGDLESTAPAVIGE
ncbi:PPE domain-containing protein [Actinosynnema sp. NPDC023658]|uniref:PPE domain-containing protein n=1 Tax=Actinosynnema sp. NPDC023658 TaxID=3155465 RepID=UPI0033DB60D9